MNINPERTAPPLVLVSRTNAGVFPCSLPYQRRRGLRSLKETHKTKVTETSPTCDSRLQTPVLDATPSAGRLTQTASCSPHGTPPGLEVLVLIQRRGPGRRRAGARSGPHPLGVHSIVPSPSRHLMSHYLCEVLAVAASGGGLGGLQPPYSSQPESTAASVASAPATQTHFQTSPRRRPLRLPLPLLLRNANPWCHRVRAGRLDYRNTWWGAVSPAHSQGPAPGFTGVQNPLMTHRKPQTHLCAHVFLKLGTTASRFPEENCWSPVLDPTV